MIDKAIKEYKVILKQNKNLEAMFNLAICYYNLKKYDKSEKLLKNIIEIDNNNFKAHRSLGDIYYNLNYYEKAQKHLRLANKLNSNDPILLNTLGLIEMKKGNYELSEKLFLKSIHIKNGYYNALNNLAALYQKNNKADDSLKIFNRLLINYPTDSNLLNNKGNVLVDLEEYESAIDCFKKSIKINPSQSSYHSNFARALFFTNKYKESNKILKNALEIDSNNHEAHLLFFYMSIIKKDLKKAWEHFDSRLYVKNYFIPNNLKKLTKINNKKILVLREAGLGDEILYSSMYAEIIKKNKNISIECDKRLKKIFKKSFNFNNFLSYTSHSKRKSNIDKFDFSIYAGSLSRMFRRDLSDFNSTDYLKPNMSYVKNYKNILNKIDNYPKIGISWISNRKDLGKYKSVELEELLSIFKKKNLTFVNLQYGDYSKKISNFNKKHNLNIIDFPKLNKFNEIEKLLALISALDLVLTVSNTTAHLAGSIGKKTFVLTPDNRAQLFYWMLNKDKTPWYPSITIFKRKKDWKEAIDNIQLKLNKLFKKK
tara:strand:- start:745 stop:2364 length:1620 start_codon:yes stop_codon:yes gene_type:complete